MRYRVIGSDEASGEAMELVVAAKSEDEARSKAAARGVRPERVESAGEAAPAAPRRPQTEDGFGEDDGPPVESGPEREVWAGGPSQWVNVKKFTGALVAAVVLTLGAIYIPRWIGVSGTVWIAILITIALPALYAMWVWIETRATNFELTTERIRERSGVFSRRLEEVELFRVKDTEVHQSLAQRIVRLGTVTLHTSDTTCPEFVLRSVPDHEELRNTIRKEVERLRKERKVREFDMN